MFEKRQTIFLWGVMVISTVIMCILSAYLWHLMFP